MYALVLSESEQVIISVQNWQSIVLNSLSAHFMQYIDKLYQTMSFFVIASLQL